MNPAGRPLRAAERDRVLEVKSYRPESWTRLSKFVYGHACVLSFKAGGQACKVAEMPGGLGIERAHCMPDRTLGDGRVWTVR
jgi:hypothetical protein